MATADAQPLTSLHGSAVESKLRRAWRKEQRFYHSRGLCFFLLWVSALILLDLVVDWLFLIPGYGRLLLLGINLAALVSVLWREWWRYLRRYNPVRTALQVERRHPELTSLLVSYVQLSGDEAAEAIASPSLLRALQREALEVTRPIDFREIVNFRELKRIVLLSAAVVAFFAIISINWSEHLRVLVLRMLNPGAELKYPTQTQILSVTGDLTAQQGDAVTVKAVAGGVVPLHGTLYVRPRDGTWETLILTGSEEAEFSHRFQEVYQPFAYRIRLGDATTEVHQVSIIPPPRIVETRVRLRYPPYTGRTEETVDILNLELPEGTAVEWDLRCDLPLRAATMVIESAGQTTGAESLVKPPGGEAPPERPAPAEATKAPEDAAAQHEAEAKPTALRVEMALDGTGQSARLGFTPAASFSYRFEWTERAHAYLYREDVHYFIQLVPDLPPQVEILTPTEDEKATVRKRATIFWQGRDDYGIAKAWIVYALNDTPEKKHPLGSFRDRLVERKSSWRLRDSIPDLKEGDLVTYLIEVADSHSGKEGPYLARSQARRLYIVSDEEYRQYIAEKRRRLLAEIRALHQQEEEAEIQVETLEATAPDLEPPPKPK